MTEDNPKKKPRSKMCLRSLRLSLKYRPELLKLILKMRQCIRKRNALIKSMKHRLSQLDTNNYNSKSSKTDSMTQTFSHNDQGHDNKPDPVKLEIPKSDVSKENAGWSVTENGKPEKSIAEQVKEAAQSALQDTGMVYVESAGMYYDYKTGYYYNSELGLYYHTETGCYYCYSEDKQFVFHSYPDMSKVNASLIAHQNKKARKLKRDKEEDGGNPKKPRKAKKTKKEKRKGKKSNAEKKKELKNDSMEVADEKQEEEEATIDSKNSDPIVKNIDSTNNNKTQEVQDAEFNVEQTTDHSEAVDIFEINKDAATKAENNSVIKPSNTKDITDPDKIDDACLVVDDIKNLEKESKPEELEDGECSDTGSEESESGSESDGSTATVSDEDSVAKQHPPCMRVIVRETNLPKLKVGSLFLITKDGGTVGREGENHAILLKDHNVSRNHLDIRYDVARKTYQVTDLGSKNGTILNGVRMSESQEVSLPLEVLHGSTIQVGESKLLCHIHPGHTTCGQCEPGLLMQVEEEKKAAYTRTVSVKKQHELELARLKNIYAPQRLAIEEKPYNDRAQARREAVGSTNHAEKTQASDVDTSIAPDNKGFKLLQKMGWSEGEGLGKDGQGHVEPVPLVSNEGKAGLGTVGAVAPPSNTPKPRVIRNNIASGAMRLAARTNMLKPPAKAFQNEDDESE